MTQKFAEFKVKVTSTSSHPRTKRIHRKNSRANLIRRVRNLFRRIPIHEEKRRDKQMTGLNATVVSPVISNSTRSNGSSGDGSIGSSFRGYTLRSCFFLSYSLQTLCSPVISFSIRDLRSVFLRQCSVDWW